MKNSPAGIILINRNIILRNGEWDVSLELRNIPGEVTTVAPVGTQILTFNKNDGVHKSSAAQLFPRDEGHKDD